MTFNHQPWKMSRRTWGEIKSEQIQRNTSSLLHLQTLGIISHNASLYLSLQHIPQTLLSSYSYHVTTFHSPSCSLIGQSCHHLLLKSINMLPFLIFACRVRVNAAAAMVFQNIRQFLPPPCPSPAGGPHIRDDLATVPLSPQLLLSPSCPPPPMMVFVLYWPGPFSP